MNNIRAIGYARKSPDDGESTESSILNQTHLIEDCAKKLGVELIDIYIDKSSSGSDRERKGFNDAINLAKKSKDIKLIIVKHQDRFCRDSSFFSEVLQDLDARDIKVYSIMKGSYLSYEDLGDMVTSVVDAHYIFSQRKKAKVLFQQKKQEGLPPMNAPFGYRIRNGKWIINEKESKIVTQVFHSLENKEHYINVVSKLGISKSKYYRVIENIKKGIYSGYIVYKWRTRDSKKVVIREEEIKYKGNHPIIIPEREANEKQN